MIFYLKENKRKKRKVYLKESSIVLLTESNNSKAARNKTKRIIAQTSGRDVNDPTVAEVERIFEDSFFGAENYRADWFIVLEPNAYSWAYGEHGDEQDAKRYLDYVKRRADIIFPEKQINAEYCRERGIEYDGTVNIKDVLTPEQFTELTNIKIPYREKRNAFITQVRQINDLYQVDSLLEPMIGQDKKAERKIARDKRNNGGQPAWNQNYDIVGPLTREQSKVYGDRSAEDGSSCKICYTQGDSTWLGPRYSDNNKNKLFILLSKDWKNVKAEHDGSERNNGLGGPYNTLNGYDNYGLSMIFLWITPEGELHESNTRWNHGGRFITGDVDKAFTSDAIERLMGCSLSDITNIDAIADKLDAIEERLANGEDFREVFAEFDSDDEDGVVTYCDEEMRFFVVKAYDRYNIYDSENNKLLLQNDWASLIKLLNPIGDFICVFGKRKYVFVTENNYAFLPIYSNEYIRIMEERMQSGEKLKYLFSTVTEIYYGYFAVWLDEDMCNIIDRNGKLLADSWQKSCDAYGNNKICLGNKENIIKNDGSLLFDVPFKEWYSRISYTDANNGIYCITKQNGLTTILREDLSPVTGEWYESVFDTINKEGVCAVRFLDSFFGYVNMRDGSTLGKGMKITTHDGFGLDIPGVASVSKADTGLSKLFVLTKNNELVGYDEYKESYIKSALTRLANGENAEDVFIEAYNIGENTFVRVEGNSWNMINKERNGLAFPFPIKRPELMSNHLILVKPKSSYYYYNFITQNGEVLIDEPVENWATSYDRLYKNDSALIVNVCDYKNIVTNDGLVFKGPVKNWPDGIYNNTFEGRFCQFNKGGKYNFVDLNTGEYLWKKKYKYWFDYVYNIQDQYFSVKLGGKKNIFSLYDGIVVKKPLNEWFNDISCTFYEEDNRFFTVTKGDKENVLEVNGGKGKLLFKQWVDAIFRVNKYKEHALYLTVNRKHNIFDVDTRKLLWNKPCEEWFDGIEMQGNGKYFRVINGGKYNLLSEKGKLVFNEWYDYLNLPKNGFCTVGVGEKKTKYNALNKKGVPISKMWFDGVSIFTPIGLCYVMKNRKSNMMDKKGNLLLKLPIKDWPTSINVDKRHGNVYLTAQYGNKFYFITRSGKFSETPVAYCKDNL